MGRGGGVLQGRYPPARSGQGGTPKVATPPPPSQVRMGGGTPLVKVGTPQHLLHGGRYASCVHAGGLSRSFGFASSGLNSTVSFAYEKYMYCHVKYLRSIHLCTIYFTY